MSTNSSCDVIEVEPGQWWYVLEEYNAPKNSWDWHEYANAYGVFPTEEAAYEHLRNNHANPGDGQRHVASHSVRRPEN